MQAASCSLVCIACSGANAASWARTYGKSLICRICGNISIFRLPWTLNGIRFCGNSNTMLESTLSRFYKLATFFTERTNTSTNSWNSCCKFLSKVEQTLFPWIPRFKARSMKQCQDNVVKITNFTCSPTFFFSQMRLKWGRNVNKQHEKARSFTGVSGDKSAQSSI